MKNTGRHQSIEELLSAFTESHANELSFPVRDAVSFVEANLPIKPADKTERTRLERDVELLLEGDTTLFYRCGGELCYNRAVFFQDAVFKILPTKLELKEGILFYGARFAPFCSEDIFADEYTLRPHGLKTACKAKSIPVQFSQVAKIFQMLGRSGMIDCIVAESPENYDALRNATSSEKALVTLTAFDLSAFYKKYNVAEGDALLFTVKDWYNGTFEFEYCPKKDFAPQEECDRVLTDFEEGLIQAYEEFGEYLEIPDQIAHAYLCAYTNRKDLRDRPYLAIEEYPSKMQDITIQRDGADWTLVPVDDTHSGDFSEIADPAPAAEHHHDHEEGCCCHEHGHDHSHGEKENKQELRPEDFSASAGKIGSLDMLLEDVSAPLDYTEIYAMIQDDLANGQDSASEFVRKLIDFMGVVFADDAQEAAFMNYVEDCWEEAASRFDPVIEETKTPLRTRLLELDFKRLERSRMLLDTYQDTEIPAKIVTKMKQFHAQLLNTLGLLNADSSLPEGKEYDMLELRIGDIEDAWDEFEEQLEKNGTAD